MIEIKPTAVPVRIKGISPLSITAKYKDRAAYTPVATIKIETKNKIISVLEIIPDANSSAPKNEITKLTSSQNVVCVRSANNPMVTPINGLRNNKKAPT